MWKIKQIFDGDYGCEELKPGEEPKLSITLVVSGLYIIAMDYRSRK